jgi:hypothetical protein
MANLSKGRDAKLWVYRHGNANDRQAAESQNEQMNANLLMDSHLWHSRQKHLESLSGTFVM